MCSNSYSHIVYKKSPKIVEMFKDLKSCMQNPILLEFR